MLLLWCLLPTEFLWILCTDEQWLNLLNQPIEGRLHSLPQWIVAACMTETTSIVSGEDYDGVVVEVIDLETVHNLPNAIINGSQHGKVYPSLWICDKVRNQVYILSWNLERGMESLVGKVEEEWITRVLL